MREIKFKIEIDNEWIALTLDEMLEYAEQGNDIIKDCRKRQYTGLKDKNGVEIYEGDIVNWDIYHNNYLMGDRKKVVVENMWALRNDSTIRNIEVIGNIYEHSNLLGDNIEQN